LFPKKNRQYSSLIQVNIRDQFLLFRNRSAQNKFDCIYVDAYRLLPLAMSACIHLIRHCAHPEVNRILSGRRPGVSLSAEGCAQAERLALHLRQWGAPASIHSSPVRRARETAEIIATRLRAEVEVIDALDELDFGQWTGRSFAELEGEDSWQRWNGTRSAARAPGGETMAEAVARAVAHIDGAARRPPAAPLLCVSHSDIIRGVIAHYLGLGLDNMLRFDVDPGSVSTLVVGNWGGRLTRLNWVAA
jgi:broad specificity phosphatase PhoE